MEPSSHQRFTSAPPSDLEGQVRWLVDRAAVSDLLLDFARRIDIGDHDGYVANFADDAVLELPFGRFEGREAIAAMPRPQPPMGSHHHSTNHQIAIDGDTARSRSYLTTTHLADVGQPDKHWKAGGWYDCEYVRTDDGWKFTHVKLNVVWMAAANESAVPSSNGAEA